MKRSRSFYNEQRLNYAQEDGKTVLCFDYSEDIQLPMLRGTPASFFKKNEEKYSSSEYRMRRKPKMDLFNITTLQMNAILLAKVQILSFLAWIIIFIII